MLIQTCIRCLKGFEQNHKHDLAHFSTICESCEKQSPETIKDQLNYNLKNNVNNCVFPPNAFDLIIGEK